MWSVVDLFSGGGGMSLGFHRHPKFVITGAADAQIGKPSSGIGALDCNSTYFANIGLRPIEENLAEIPPKSLVSRLKCKSPNVLIACAPCTGFSRTLNANHSIDDPRNSLVVRTGEFVQAFDPDIFLMENARELLKGNFSHHSSHLIANLNSLGYTVSSEIHFLDRFGLPQTRERALIIAAKNKYQMRTLPDLWSGFTCDKKATIVRNAIGHLNPIDAGERDIDDEFHVSPSFTEPIRQRIEAIPTDGGSWSDLISHSLADELLTSAMKKYIKLGKLGSHPDVYGRMAWNQPAVTIKRECGHVGNGRYAHPEQTRLCSVREMSILQGFPTDFAFGKTSLGNMYRHIGDAVPPLISFQLAGVCEWILSGNRPELESLILRNTHMTPNHLKTADFQHSFEFVNV